MGYKFDCRHFTGYKPCRFARPCDGCDRYEVPGRRIAIISLEALGAVLRSTVLLPPLRRRHPDAHITWITLANAVPLLRNNPMIDDLIIVEDKQQALLQYLSFDELLVVDKSRQAGALAMMMKAAEKRGFGLNEQGVIYPLTEEASYQFDVGLDDDLKFYRNEKPETRMVTESMGLRWERDPYVLQLTETEKEEVARRRDNLVGEARGVIGYSTGCSVLYPYKKFTVPFSIELIRKWRHHFPDYVVALMGGREDQERNAAMKDAFADDPLVVSTPCDQGLRSGLMWMDTADVILSGCSLGLHIAIALQKPLLTWFGVSCAQEIDLYDRGVKLKAAVSCSPCWKKSCSQEPKCYDEVSMEELVDGTARVLQMI